LTGNTLVQAKPTSGRSRNESDRAGKVKHSLNSGEKTIQRQTEEENAQTSWSAETATKKLPKTHQTLADKKRDGDREAINN
jgi:hypothetical protein